MQHIFPSGLVLVKYNIRGNTQTRVRQLSLKPGVIYPDCGNCAWQAGYRGFGIRLCWDTTTWEPEVWGIFISRHGKMGARDRLYGRTNSLVTMTRVRS